MKNSKNRKSKYNIKRRAARTFVVVLSLLALIFNIIPMPDMSFISEKFANIKVVRAAEDYDTNPTLRTVQNLVDYSIAYQNFPQNHQFDNITIAFTTGDTDIEFTDFVPIGTASKPFGGTVTIDATTSHDMNLNCAFFDYVYDYAEIITSNDRNMVIKTTADHTDAVFANHVLHDETANYGDSRVAANAQSNTTNAPKLLGKGVVKDIEEQSEEITSEEELNSEQEKSEEKSELEIESDSEGDSEEISEGDSEEISEGDSEEISEEISEENTEKQNEESDNSEEINNDSEQPDNGQNDYIEDNPNDDSVSNTNEESLGGDLLNESVQGNTSDLNELNKESMDAEVQSTANSSGNPDTVVDLESAISDEGETNNEIDGDIYDEGIPTTVEFDSETNGSSEIAEISNESIESSEDAESDDNTGDESELEDNTESESDEEGIEPEEDTSEIVEDEENNKEDDSNTASEDEEKIEDDSSIDDDDSSIDDDEKETGKKEETIVSRAFTKLAGLRNAASGVTPRPSTVAYAHWVIEVANYKNSVHNHGSLIGEMQEDAKVTVTLINNSTGKYESSINTGMICGTVGTGEGGATLIVAGISGSVSNIRSTSGSAGGFVGELKPNSVLTLSNDNNAIANVIGTITGKIDAGGLAGSNNQATVNPGAYSVSIVKDISGESRGAGGVYGYYCPAKTGEPQSLAVDLTYDLDLVSYSIGTSSNKTKITSSSGAAGGLFGVLENLGGEITIKGTNSKPIYVQGAGNIFGGAIGRYIADSIADSLKIEGTGANARFTVNALGTNGLNNYGGIIGKVSDIAGYGLPAFISAEFINVTANNPDKGCFGGVVSKGDLAYVYVNNMILEASGYTGGGIVGYTEEGVVHLAGATDFSKASAAINNVNYGQLVGYRDKAFVFAESGWNYTRNTTTAVTADDIGSWGEIVRFKTSDFTIGNVLDSYYDVSDASPVHYVTLKNAPFDGDGNIILSNKETFARAALNMQLNNGVSSDVLKFAEDNVNTYDELSATDVLMSKDIDLSHTGMTGLTRDNDIASWTSGIGPAYAGGLFDGRNKKLTLAIGETYEGTDSTSSSTDASGKGKIYCHRFNGLFGELTNGDFIVQNLEITGKVYTFAKSGMSPFYVGTVAGHVTTSFAAQNVTVNTGTNVIYGTSSETDELYVGGLVGKISSPETILIGSDSYSGETNCTFGANISGSASSSNAYIGGVVGLVGGGGSITVYDVEITNASLKVIENRAEKTAQKMGGLFGVVLFDANNDIKLDGIELNNLTIKGNMSSDGSMGGLLGYSWEGGSVVFDNIMVTDCALNNDSEETGGKAAGLLYSGSGYWKFKQVELSGVSLSGERVNSFGMLVNMAGYNGNALYLELPENYIYTIENVTNSGMITSDTVYDEIAACSKMGNNKIEENGNSLVSISTQGTTKYGFKSGVTVNMKTGSCNTYQNQVVTDDFNTFNPNTRYYYNLDKYKSLTPVPGNTNKLLLVHSVKQYAHSSISGLFTDNFNALTLADNTSFDMNGLSYYPYDVTGTESISIRGKVTLYNSDIETREAETSGDEYARTTLRDTDNNTITQHYLMHAGLFRNVSSSVTVSGKLQIAGTVPLVDNYCGALVCGTVGGDSKSDAVITSESGSIVLNGIKIYNKNSTYSPLLINRISEFADLKINNISAIAGQYTSGAEIATSLIGVAGSETARSLKITFSGVKLDGRTSTNTKESGITTYGTTHSLFTRATLLESLSYASGTGSSGVYNYEYDEDWGGDRNVTYGFEISDQNSTNAGLEYYYYGKFGDSSYYTNPLQDSTEVTDPEPYQFNQFLPYVYVSGSRITNRSVQHQLDVNHSAATFGGCGTYNDPYTIAYDDKGDESPAYDGGLQTIANIISLENLPQSGFSINLPDDITTPDTWCEDKTSCKSYVFDGSNNFVYTNTVTGDTITRSKEAVSKYLAGAYYSINSDIIYLDENFQGLGNSATDDGVFRGVIYGNGNTIYISSNNPLIYASNGSVVYNLKIETHNAISLSGNNSSQFASHLGCGAYGAVIGRVLGGDNIIDQVKVDVSGSSINQKTILTPIGGYVGVIVKGGVFFRNMDLVDLSLKTGFTGGEFAEDNYNYLYCNPLIGRVISGFAVNETTQYAPYENGTRVLGDGTTVISGAEVSLHNGNKNYSITDINPQNTKKLNVENNITVPDSQAFFIMSLIVNSGMGTDSSSILGYYGTNQITRHAEYKYVGTDEVSSATESEAIKDYNKTEDDVPSKPYLINQYATGSKVKQLGTTKFSTLTLSDNIILPDGYKGTGNVFIDDSSLRMALTTFNGGDYSVSQNTSFFSYTKDSGNKDNYLPYTSLVHGLGLFNYMDSNSGTYKNCILKGNVVARQYSAGKVLDYTNSFNHTALATGMLIGTLNMNNTNATITDIYLQNVYSESTRDAGGMIGYLCDTNGKKLTVTNTTEKTDRDSEKIYVNAGTSAGGLVARQGDATAQPNKGDGNFEIIFNNHFFNYSSIVSRYNGDLDTESSHTNWNQEWALGVGGLIGITRNGTKDSTAPNKHIIIDGVNIGSSNDKKERVVACEYKNSDNQTVQGKIYVGGLVGVANKAPIDATNCNIYNVTARSANYSGGVLGWGGTWSNITLDHFKIINTRDSKIYSSSDIGKAGCVVGFSKGGTDGNSMGSLKMLNSTIEGYTVEGHYAGGAMGDWNSSKPFSLINSEIKDCKIVYNAAGGGIAGQLMQSLNGYNVRVSDITFTKKGSETKQGYIAGDRTGTIKIVGLHRTGNISEEKLIGTKSYNNTTMDKYYGTGGYVIFADYLGKSVDEDNTTPSSFINNTGVNPVTNLASTPYITVNPANTIDPNIGLITSDGVDLNARNSILTDSSAKRYQLGDVAYFKTNGEINTNYISSFSTELGEVIKDKTYDFPMLIVNDTTTAEEVVNKYLGVLTNTKLDFSNYVDGQAYGTVNGNDAIGRVSINRCYYQDGSFIVSNANDACLTIDSSTNKFVIRKDSSGNEQYDTAKSSGQFTMIDIAFKVPTESDAAYHLYVPVYVKKLLEYSFDIAAVSGTNYDRAVYESDYGNTLIENLGTPITLEFKYTYFRTAEEWSKEGTDYNYAKKLKFNCQSGDWVMGSDTKMLLVDANNNGKVYYLDTLSTGLSNGILDLSKFEDSNGNKFKPVNFENLDSNSAGNKEETYYLCIFTNQTEGLNYHYIISNSELNDIPSKPTRRVDCKCPNKTSKDYHYATHILLGDFYENSITVTTSTQSEEMNMSNKQVDANLTATVNFKEDAKTMLANYIGNSRVHIYQTLLASFEKYDKNGALGQSIAYVNYVGINSYTITQGANVTTIQTTAITDNASFIELPNNTDIKTKLQDGVVTISADISLVYTNEANIEAEFPFRNVQDQQDRSGALVVGYSNISSNTATLAYSGVSNTDSDTYGRKYYSATVADATLQYNASYVVRTGDNQYRVDNQLGINGLEMTPHETAEMHSIGIYDTSKLSEIEDVKYILCELELYQRTDNTSESYNELTPVVINKYIASPYFTVSGNDPNIVKGWGCSETGNKYYYVLDIDTVAKETGKVYSIPIDFNVINSGDLEADGLQYGNYKLKLTTTLLKEYDSSTGYDPEDLIDESKASDYVIYTNAKVYTDRIH